MAEVLIRGMEMPISGATFRVVEDLDGNKFLTSADCMNGLYYPLVEVSPHGRLIDADALINEMEKQENAMYEHGREFTFSFKSGGDVCTAWYNVEMMIEDAPTVVPASEVKNNG